MKEGRIEKKLALNYKKLLTTKSKSFIMISLKRDLNIYIHERRNNPMKDIMLYLSWQSA